MDRARALTGARGDARLDLEPVLDARDGRGRGLRGLVERGRESRPPPAAIMPAPITVVTRSTAAFIGSAMSAVQPSVTASVLPSRFVHSPSGWYAIRSPPATVSAVPPIVRVWRDMAQPDAMTDITANGRTRRPNFTASPRATHVPRVQSRAWRSSSPALTILRVRILTVVNPARVHPGRAPRPRRSSLRQELPPAADRARARPRLRGLGPAGTRYLDMTAGIAVCGARPRPPAVHRARCRAAAQARPRLEPVLQRPADPRRAGDHRALVRRSACSSATRARRPTRRALKLARRYQASSPAAPQRTTIVSTHGSFHGRSIATSSITGQPKYREGFGPLVGPRRVHPVRRSRGRGARCSRRAPRARIIVEPIQAEGGIVVAPPGYLAGLRRLCDDTGTILIFDEVQTGVGRTGTLVRLPARRRRARRDDARQGPRRRRADRRGRVQREGGRGLARAGRRGAARVDVRRQPARVRRGARGVRDHRDGGAASSASSQARRVPRRQARGARRGVPRAGPGARARPACAGSPSRARRRTVTARVREKGVLLSVAGDKVVRFAPPFIVTSARRSTRRVGDPRRALRSPKPSWQVKRDFLIAR